MTDNILLEASFAAARKALAGARDAQKKAVLAAMDLYRAGARGRRARLDHKKYDRLRAAHLAEACRIRNKIHELRAMVRELEARHDAGGDASLLLRM